MYKMDLALLTMLLCVISGVTSYAEPCPGGCRCSASAPMRRHYRWNRWMSAYRMRWYRGGLFNLRDMASNNAGREMTCVGLTKLPRYVPTGKNMNEFRKL